MNLKYMFMKFPYAVMMRFRRTFDSVHMILRMNYFRTCQWISLEEGVKIFPEAVLVGGGYRSGSISIGECTFIRGNLELQSAQGSIHIGSRCYIGDHTHIWAADIIEIGDNVLIAHNCNLFDSATHPTDLVEREQDFDEIVFSGIHNSWSSLTHCPIYIKDNAWVGCNCTVLKGVTIGRGAIIGTGSVVTSDIPDYAVAAGNPAKVVKILKIRD